MEYLKFILEELKSLSKYYLDNGINFLRVQQISRTINELEETICAMMKKS